MVALSWSTARPTSPGPAPASRPACASPPRPSTPTAAATLPRRRAGNGRSSLNRIGLSNLQDTKCAKKEGRTGIGFLDSSLASWRLVLLGAGGRLRAGGDLDLVPAGGVLRPLLDADLHAVHLAPGDGV